MTRHPYVFAIALLAAFPASAINKCHIDGKMVFQDAPCPGKGETVIVKPASGYQRAAETHGGDKPLNEAQRIEENIAASQRDRRRRELTERQVPGAEQAIRAHLKACEAEQARLEMAKGRYVQNLYGKTDAAQRAAEQAAAAARCQTRDRELREQHTKLLAECKDLGGCN